MREAPRRGHSRHTGVADWVEAHAGLRAVALVRIDAGRRQCAVVAQHIEGAGLCLLVVLEFEDPARMIVGLNLQVEGCVNRVQYAVATLHLPEDLLLSVVRAVDCDGREVRTAVLRRAAETFAVTPL